VEQAQLEDEVKTLVAAAQIEAATTLIVRELGPELLGFLVVVVRDRTDAGDVFADLCTRIWKSIATFGWRCSLRTWCYVLARHACHAWHKDRARRGEEVPLSAVPELEAMMLRVRTSTFARLDRQPSRADRLRAKLTPDEQTLLTLRIDRELDWREIALVLADKDLDDDALTREAASLRKRYERLKDKLRKLAETDVD
jgi:RNA polymerase sigma-70 factor (ECF subfamily)